MLACFDRRDMIAAVEGLSIKPRLITRRSYGLKLADSLWRRLAFDVNLLGGGAHRPVPYLHAPARSIQVTFTGYYT